MESLLIGVSDALAAIAARAAPALAAVHVAPGQLQPGLLWRENLVLTAVAGLPALDQVCLGRPGGAIVSGHVMLRDPGNGIAAIGLDSPAAPPGFALAGPTRAGALAMLVGATAEAEPTARLAVVHAAPVADAGLGARLVLDAGLCAGAAGGPVLDAAGCLLGIALASGPDGLARVVPHAVLTTLFSGIAPAAPGRRAWLGLALQPVATRVGGAWRGHGTGRRVMAVEPDSPGARAGITVGDTLLAIDGRPINGQRSLREFLAGERVGQTVDLELARNDVIETRKVTIAPHPND
ncbi:MAG: serine protease [Proteobacteria bacterium]|nr:serine protease [Pseudomonadota bacterium]